MDKTTVPSGGSLVERPDFLGMAEGPVAIRMTNDYLFHALFQEDNEALKGFICALLRLDAEQVKSAVVINPIELGTSIQDKDFILDIKVLLDDRAIINLELQVINHHNWPERSLSYLCRAFDNLNPGESYQMVKPVVHIGLLDFTLFPEFPEFYATYRFMNTKNHRVYSDKLQLSVVDLTHIDLATEKDTQHRIDCWAAFFKANTWEEIKMIAQRDENIAKASNTVWKLSQEDKIRLQCEAREDYYRNQRDMQNYMNKQASIIAQRESLIASQERLMAQQEGKIAQQEGKIAQQEGKIAQQEGTITRQAELLSEKDSTIEALQAELERLKGKSRQE
jgi:predicted transposase/invertase (TIGR01784 family)|nr:Rpn family recombination-promoting nuclease/putative transposase [uncultured Acetatifactor sp.]